MFSFTTIKNYQEQLTQGTFTCLNAVDYYLANIQKLEHLNAFVEVYSEEARNRARDLDTRLKDGKAIGKLHGVVIALKDVICYKGHNVTAASKILAGYEAVYNATAVQRLLDAGAIIIGNCNCDEFAMGSTNENSVYGPVQNAADTNRVPGGSSGGSAVAVQADMCMASLGSDTGGSVRQPADFCGIVGLKPSYGRISRYGLIAYASSFDQIGIFTSNVEDNALILSVISGPDDFDATAVQEYLPEVELKENHHKKFRIGYFAEALDHPSLDKEISAKIYNCIGMLKEAGHTVLPVSFDLLDYVVPAYYVLTTAEASSNLSRYDGVRFGYRTVSPVSDLTDLYNHTRSEGFGAEVQRRIMLGTFVLSAGYYDAYFAKAQQIRKILCDQTSRIFNDLDVLFMPVSPSTAFKKGELTDDPLAMYLADIYTVFANLAGIPGIALPLFKHSNGMPFGLQIMSRQLDELTLLRFSAQLMQQYPNHSHLINQ